jgi:uncharacterized protein YjbI with pentapeptide repeats
LALASGVALAIVLVVVLIVYVPLGLRWYLSPTTDLSISQRKDLVQGIAAVGQAVAVGLTGAAGFIGLAFTWRGLRQTRESTQKTLELTEQGQITERFTSAINQLGATDDDRNKNMDIRVGGIYALERIAKESPEDHWAIMEVLTAYVRHHARRQKSPDAEAQEDVAEVPHPGFPGHSQKGIPGWEYDYPGWEYDYVPDVVLEPDIRAIMTIIRRRKRYYQGGEPEPLDLRETDLPGANLPEVNLRKAQLDRANLQKANLREANLGGALQWAPHAPLEGKGVLMPPEWGLRGTAAHFDKADLREAVLANADLRGTSLRNANLRGASLRKANLRCADLQYADLRRAVLKQADLRDATLSATNFQMASLEGANLSEQVLPSVYHTVKREDRHLIEDPYRRAPYLRRAILRKSNLEGDFSQADLRDADLREANLQNTSLVAASLQGADLRGADLQGADLQGAKLERAIVNAKQLADAASLKGATMPDGQKFEGWLKSKARGEDGENSGPSS